MIILSLILKTNICSRIILINIIYCMMRVCECDDEFI